ncbi:MAG: dUTP diphosphatase [Dehalococcoidia bacterium]|nr:dUTP diphosphatase [Dehalococcoidia bacterium]
MQGGEVTVIARLLRPGARLPYRATEQASGYDIYAALEGGEVTVGQHPVIVPTGIALELPPGYDAQFRPRSGLAAKGVLATFGTLDADYRGEIKITLYTTAPDITHTVRDGDRIAQLVINRLVVACFELAEELSASARGTGGHGSTGR